MGTTPTALAAPLPQQFIKTRASGPSPANVLICGEAPGGEEEAAGVPFVGRSGEELDRMLIESAFLPPIGDWKQLREERNNTIFLTNVCKYRPPENKIEAFFLDSKQTKPNELIKEGIGELLHEIARVKPKLIILMGGTALWALTLHKGITKWRGSMLEYRYQDSEGTQRQALLLPTYHPALILREWSWRSIALHDLRRARTALGEGAWPKRNRNFTVRPSFPEVMDVLGTLTRKADEAHALLRISSDLETRGGYIACHGIAWSESDAICIPNMCVERPTGYFTLDQDIALWERERTLLTHRNVEVVGQNYLYDAQYFARRRGYVPRLLHDTMFMQHCAFAGLPKGLDFMSSMYREHHIYWKEEGKEWNPSIPEENYWAYNCEDAIATFEVASVLEQTLKKMGLWDSVYLQQMKLWRPALDMMLRGVRIDQLSRGNIASQLIQAMMSREQWLHGALGYPINLDSPKQVHDLFYDQFKCKIIRNRKTKQPTCDEEALQTFAQREPLLKPFTDMIVDIRGLGSMMSNIIKAELDYDGHLRSELSPTGAETFRWSSRKNAFKGGTNLMNWTKGDEDKEAEAIKHTFPVPNVRKLVIPDLGFEIGSIDLTGADAQTIAWEAGDEDLKQVFRENKIKIHAHNAMQLFKGKCKTGYEQPYYDLSRTGVHLINFLGGIEELAGSMGITWGEAEEFKTYWFTLHPKILELHRRVEDELSKTRMVTNGFGYQRRYFDRMEGLLPKAIAWKAQSNTAIVTNRAIVALDEDQLLRSLSFQLLFQVHDEIVFQYPPFYRDQILARVNKLAHITIPYSDPLIIPWGLKTSNKSWGECEKREWPSEIMTTG